MLPERLGLRLQMGLVMHCFYGAAGAGAVLGRPPPSGEHALPGATETFLAAGTT